MSFTKAKEFICKMAEHGGGRPMPQNCLPEDRAWGYLWIKKQVV
jgi:hypothetical protein